MALQGLLAMGAGAHVSVAGPDGTAAIAYMYADAMIKEQRPNEN